MRTSVYLLVIAFTVLLFDVSMYWLLPSDYDLLFGSYRYRPGPGVLGRGNYPKGYFVAHQARGFDMGIHKSGQHSVESTTYPIWTNSMGCFDQDHQAYDQYVYVTGDSFAWGYTPYDQKVATLIERRTHTQIAKCGITHTGQRHQYAKMVDFLEQAGTLPEAVFVFYYANDIANDYAYPHSTVLSGWLVDSVVIDRNNQRVELAGPELVQQMGRRLRQLQKENSPLGKLEQTIDTYSLSAHLIVELSKRMRQFIFTESDLTNQDNLSTRGIYSVLQERSGRFWYTDNPIAEANQAAILSFQRFASTRNIPLVLVLIPPKRTSPFDTEWYSELHSFLQRQGIRFVDLSSYFVAKGLTSAQLYWKHDGHLNPYGNQVIADIVIEQFPQVFGSR